MKHIMPVLALLLLALAAAVPARRGAQAQAAPMLVIISEAAGIADISSALLRRTFMGQPSEYAPGKRLVPLNLPAGTPERGRFDRAVLGMTPDEAGLFWIDQKIRGAASPPRSLASGSLAVRVVVSFVGAITYTDPSMLRPGVVALSIDGKAPTDPGYLLAP